MAKKLSPTRQRVRKLTSKPGYQKLEQRAANNARNAKKRTAAGAWVGQNMLGGKKAAMRRRGVMPPKKSHTGAKHAASFAAGADLGGAAGYVGLAYVVSKAFQR